MCVTWWVMEVKAPGARIFGGNDSAKALSTEANRGVLQLLEYIDVCAENQAYLREADLRDYASPRDCCSSELKLSLMTVATEN
jgi:hypothetical protein